GMHIPEEATAVHHITDEDVASEPQFKQVAKSLAEWLRGCDFAGFNSNRFDLPLLDQEFARAQVDFDFGSSRFIDVQTIYHKREPRTLVAAYRYYCDRNLDDAHSAMADTRATYEVLMAQIKHYGDLPENVEELSEYASQNRNVDFMGRLIYDEDGSELINFGKYKGKKAEEVLRHDPGYYTWIMGGDFSNNTKQAFTRINMRVRGKHKS
ncbi:MAG: 3'-5' exonuclease, partial [Muribaculaceae bacterium]|nr:3'-5' exonuclease [Muribaculaceae bacterium]